MGLRLLLFCIYFDGSIFFKWAIATMFLEAEKIYETYSLTKKQKL